MRFLTPHSIPTHTPTHPLRVLAAPPPHSRGCVTPSRGACSKRVRPCAPLGRAADMDYDVLSDEEWEEEPEGEELGGAEAEEEDEEKGSDDEDDDFMVEGTPAPPFR